MNPDITELLRSWPYDPDNEVRIISANDGREVIQVRTPLGIEQMELHGRPDGLRPMGMESFFDYYLSQLEKAKKEGRESEFELNHAQCIELFNEATLYYLRYLRLFQLQRWELTIRDTNRNLRVFDFVKEYACEETDKWYLEKWRPYILRINGVARAMLVLESGDPYAAINIVQDTINKIRSLPPLEDETFEFEYARSLKALEELLTHLRNTFGKSELERLEEELRWAIEEQAFERAAELRDRIRALKAKQTPPTNN
jgi:hypothetical protein